jgi:Cd2+/Zn2+-exporting ATPase
LPVAGTAAPSSSAKAQAPAPGKVTRYAVDGLCCAAEARQIEAKLAPHPGVISLRIDPVHHTLDVAGGVTPETVVRLVADLGMRARPADVGAPERSWWDRHGRVVLVTAAGALFIATLVAGALVEAEIVVAGLAVAAVLAGGWYVLPRGFRAAKHAALDMNFLMSVAALGALAIGEFVEAAAVLFLFSLAQLLEARSMDRARNAIRSLMTLAPAEATVLRNGAEVRVPADDVRVNDHVIVRPGQRIPVDGAIVAGRSSVDQAPITGEAMPVPKEAGDAVFAGTVNGEGALEIRSTKPAADTTLARIIHSVEAAQATRAPSQTFVDRFARIYTPIVVAAAVALAIGPPLLGFGPWGDWFYRALALLVVACPCALVISTPVTVVSALAGGARRGILIKGGLHLENAGRARVVVFDKTGTLTEGRPEVATVVTFDDGDAAGVLRLAAAAQAHSEHPLADAIRRHAVQQGLAVASPAETRAMAGRGVQAIVEGRRIIVGSERLFTELGVREPIAFASAERLEAGGNTVMLVGVADGVAETAAVRLVGAIAVADRVRDSASAALHALRKAGTQRIVMLTGDNAATARAVAGALGARIDEVRSGLLPDDKVDAIRALSATYGTVIMVGDGINDAPALAAADVGVAMGAAGTDVALETADIALMADDLAALPLLLRLARKAEAIIRGNIAFALLVKAVFVVLAASGIATLWMAVVADMGASLLVIGNGLRALRV